MVEAHKVPDAGLSPLISKWINEAGSLCPMYVQILHINGDGEGC